MLPDTKPALSSKGVWGGLISGAMSLAVTFFSLDFSPEAQQVVSDFVLLVIGAVGAGGSVLAIVGRILAKVKIG